MYTIHVPDEELSELIYQLSTHSHSVNWECMHAQCKN